MKLTIIHRIYYWRYTEAVIWLTSFLFLFLSVRFGVEGITLCPLKLAGFDHCPGCGLGTSVGLLLNGKWEESLNAHVLGIPALLIISYRIISIIKQK